MVTRLHVWIAGRVQGVGFRFSTYRQATALGLNGWVRNLYDGRVEAEFEGAEETVKEMLDWCRQGPRFAQVTQVDTEWAKGDPQHTEFRCLT